MYIYVYIYDIVIIASKKSSNVKVEKDYSTEEIEEMASQILPSEVISGLVDSNWKTRLSAVEQLSQVLQIISFYLKF